MARARTRADDAGVKRHLTAFALVLALTAGVALAHPSAPAVGAAQLKARFKAATGDRLLVNRNMSYAGHYTAFDVGPPTIASKGKYGTFAVYLVTGPDLEAEVTDLLADSHTGVLGQSSAGNIHWEAGTSIHGDRYWMAKRRYGSNVVLTWIGVNSARRATDRSFKRLHAALTRATR
jgi:hypothetical protein